MKHTERWKNILALAWPLIIANSFWNLQLTIDRILLGAYSTEALAAAMAVSGVFWAPMALLQQTAAYVTTFVAQYFGARQSEKVGPAIWHALYLSVGGGLLFLLLIPLSEPFFHWVGHGEHLVPLEAAYFKTLCLSAMPTAIVAVASGFFTGLGNTRIIIAINCIGFVFNFLFAYVLISGHWGFPAMGIAGAGYATAAANWLA
ncbi:MATE family efflux transporter, partial [bacterium]|nr:MATE family efflux transporter [bacterium]